MYLNCLSDLKTLQLLLFSNFSSEPPLASVDGEAKLIVEDGKAVVADGGADKVKDGAEGTGKKDRSSHSKSPDKLKNRYLEFDLGLLSHTGCKPHQFKLTCFW